MAGQTIQRAQSAEKLSGSGGRHASNADWQDRNANGRDEKIRQRMAVTYGEKGRKAVTEYFTKKDYLDHTLVEVNPLEWSHAPDQVHMAYIGCPVAGDRVYGRRKSSLEIDRFFLHASG